MRKAGGRLFVDVTPMLASRDNTLNYLGRSDPLIKDALMTVIERDFIKTLPDEIKTPSPIKSITDTMREIENNPAIVPDLIQRSQASIEALKQNIQTKSGADLFDFILEDLQQLKKFVFDPQSLRVILAAMDAATWINENMNEWLGEKHAADTLSQSVSDNITSEMGLALLDVADVIRPYPEIIEYLQHVTDEHFWMNCLR